MYKIMSYITQTDGKAKECFYQGFVVFLFMLLSSLIFSIYSADGGLMGVRMHEYAIDMLKYAWICLLESVVIAGYINLQAKKKI